MTSPPEDNCMPAIEALGEALAALDGKREAFRAGRDLLALVPPWKCPAPYAVYTADASQAIQHLANSGWTLTPGPTVNAGEDANG